MSLSLVMDDNLEVYLLNIDKNSKLNKINDFLNTISKESKTLETRKKNANNIKAYLEFLDSKGYSYDKVNRDIIIEFRDYLINSNGFDMKTQRSSKAANNILATVKKFYYFCDNDYSENSLLGSLGEGSKKRKESSIFKVKETFKESTLISHNNAKELVKAFVSWRDILIFKLLYLTGISITDILQLRIEDINMAKSKNNEIHKRKKSGSYLKVTVDEKLMDEIIRYINYERINYGNKNDYLFVNQAKPHLGRQISYRAIHHSFSIAKEKVGLDFGFNDVRKSYFNNLVRNGSVDFE